jgi:predicted helicase
LTPDAESTWLVPEHADEYRSFAAMEEMFGIVSNGLKSNRDDVVYDWDRAKLATRMKKFIAAYNAEVYRHKADPAADWPEAVNWSRDLKQDCLRGHLAEFGGVNLRHALYRPFTKRWLYFDRIMNEEVYQWPKISGRVIVISDIGWRAPISNALMTDAIADLHLCAAIDAHQCFPLSHLKDSAVEQFRTRYSDPSITKEDVFHYLYALLHDPEYRERYADNLKRELPRVPFAPDFRAFAEAGRGWHGCTWNTRR